MKRIIVTGAAGFIGFHLCCRLLSEGYRVIGIDALLETDDLWIKQIRLKNLLAFDYFDFYKERVSLTLLEKLKYDVACIIHLAAVSGIERFEKNEKWARRITIEAAQSIAEYSQNYNIPIFYASSSSVYGNIPIKRFSENVKGLKPISSYAKAKLEIEEIFLRSLAPTIGLRFFTVYGEYGRPDMSYFRFAELINQNKPVYIFGKGIKRDFTYINDLSTSILLLLKRKDKIFKEYGKNLIVNIGTGKSIEIESIVYLIGRYLNRIPIIRYTKRRKYDLKYTCSDNRLLKKITGYVPDTRVEIGIEKFIHWFKYILPREIEAISQSR